MRILTFILVFLLGAAAALGASFAGLLPSKQPDVPPPPAESAALAPALPPTAASPTPVPVPASAPVPRDPRYALCEGAAEAPRLSRLQLASTEPPLWSVHCGATLTLISVEGAAENSVLRRVAQLHVQPSVPTQSVRSAAVLISDVSGDGRADLLAPFRFHDETGAPRAGGLYELPRDARGGFGAPSLLSSSPVIALAAGHFLGTQAMDLAVVSLEDPRLSAPSQLSLMRGGAAPLRVQTIQLGIGAKAALGVDLDLDSRDEALIVSDNPALEALFFDAQGQARERKHWEAKGALDLLAADIDGDGHDDVAISGDAIGFLLSAKTSTSELTFIAGSEHVQGLRAADVDADGKTDFIAFTGSSVIAFVQTSGGGFERRVLCTLGQGLTPLSLAVVATDEQASSLLVLGMGSDAAHIELGLTRCNSTERAWQAQAQALQDVPLSLRYELR